MSLEEEDFGSDTDDDDYVPDCDPVVASEEENSGDDEGGQDEASAEGGKQKRKKKTPGEAVKKKKKTVTGGRGFMFEEESRGGEGSVDWKAEVEKEKAELNKEVEKKKTDDIWAEFKRDTGGGAVKPKPKPIGGEGLASVLAPTPPTAKNSVPAKPKSRFGDLFDKVEPSKEEAVGEEGAKEAVKEKPKNRFGSLFDAPPKVEEAKESEESSVKCGDNKVEITKVFDFAGEVVKVSKQVSADSKEAAKFLSEEATSSTTQRSGGLAGVLGSITKKPKMGCLDKSKLDWNQFVLEKNIRLVKFYI